MAARRDTVSDTNEGSDTPESPVKTAASGETGDPLHGVTLQMMLERLRDALGWEGLAEKIHINCFDVDPSISSSLKFLRKTPWARQKVELLYLYVFHKKKAGELAKRRRQEDDRR